MSIFTLGCKVNRYDSEAIEETFVNAGYTVVPFDQKADVYIINTCTVTHMSDRKSRQMIRRTKKINPDAVVAVIGCYAQAAQEEIEAIEEVDLVIGTNGRIHVLEAVEEYRLNGIPMNFVEDIMKVHEFEELKINNMNKRTRAYLKIQEGCNNYCSYCIIPYVRGNIRSRKPDNILSEVTTLAREGFKEIVLTGIHVASYGKDLKDTNLLEIIKMVHGVEGIERIRLSSIEPNVVTAEFVEVISKLPKVCHHFHLSLQSGSDTVLQRMKRKYTAAQYKEAVEVLRKTFEDVAFTTDIIVGFPGETTEEFNETVAFIKDIQFSDIHIFPYSPRSGTPAATMEDQVSPQIKDQRVKELTAVSSHIKDTMMETYLGKTVKVLFEQNHGDDVYEGHTENYTKIHSKSQETLINKIVDVTITSIIGDVLYGMTKQSSN
ncbi:MAG TPA: tRNA (N(6)-L-threonylcarbamoyladenosine(37)-C(2))-methylthiotransferase MtaB [Epulopiscium sp.]|nr:tRNA (N(6)-L-threonylcarbamoyladenosine(37)-C(2))-methylthiotransferase MtaB [Candidatus Epulonipiscium sp.]